MSENGKSILMLTATSDHGTKSRIVPRLSDMTVVVPRGDVHYVATEYGVVNLFGKTLQERATALISIAHPDFRDELFAMAQEMELINKHRRFKEAIKGVYPLKYEEKRHIKDMDVMFRPARPHDDRAIQEHYYTMKKGDIVSRFFHEKKNFARDQIDATVEIDYINDLTIIATLGELGFEKIVAVGEYFKNPLINMAEIAFSVNEAYQGNGLAWILLQKLALAAKENGIKGLLAYTSPNNAGMIRLFNKLPYPVETEKDPNDPDVIVLKCVFDTPAQPAEE